MLKSTKIVNYIGTKSSTEHPQARTLGNLAMNKTSIRNPHSIDSIQEVYSPKLIKSSFLGFGT